MKDLKRNRSLPILFDTVLVICFLIIALAFTLGIVGTHFSNYVSLSSDAANISSFAAALDHPEYFVHDALLKNPGNFAFYSTIHIPLIRLLANVMGNYGSAFALLIFPITFLHLLGYYVLGNVLFKNRIWALLFTLTVMVPVPLNLGENWGILHEAVPRYLFQAVLPFVLAALLKWGRNPKSWPWLMAAIGLLVYTHPVSLPAWGTAVFLSLWFMSTEMPLKQKIIKLGLAALVFLIVITPFTINYLSTTTFGAQEAGNYTNILNIMRKRFIPGFIDLLSGYKDFIKTTVISNWLNVLLWLFVFAAGIFSFLYFRKKKPNWTGMIISAWWLGIFIMGVIVPVVDHAITSTLQRMPLEVDLIRSLRYVIPLLLLSAFFLISELKNILINQVKVKSKPAISYGFFTIGFLLMLGWMLRYQFFLEPAFSQTASCWKSGLLICPLPDEDKINQRIELLNAIKTKTSVGATILGTDLSDLDIRFYSLRSLVYTYKDGGALIYANHLDLLTWYQQFQEMSAIENDQPNRKAYLDGLVNFAHEYQSDYLVLPVPYQTGLYLPETLKNIFTNQSFSFFQVIK